MKAAPLEVIWWKRAVIALLTLGVVYGLGEIAGWLLLEYVQRIVLLAGINVILAVGLNLINGTTGQFSIGHAGFMAVGAYAAAISGTWLRGAFGEVLLSLGAVGQAIIFNLALLSGAAFAALAGLVVGVPSLRLKGDYLAVVTLGFGEIIRILFNNATALGAATGYFGDDPAGLPAYTSFFWVFGWATLVTIAVANLTYSQIGRSLVAIREDEIAAEAMGTPTIRLKVMAFTVSAAAAGIAGGLFAHMQSGIRPEDFRFEKSIDMVVMIIVGGLGSISGAVVGGIFVAVSLELMRDFQEYRLVLYALLLIAIMLLRPQGLLGTSELTALWRRKGEGKAT
jgi:branched-chain amino acid transport system permease protein